MAKVRSIGVFCGSRMGERKSYQSSASHVGEAIAKAGARLVYGGGDVGLMGLSASAAAANGGKVLGIIPDFLIAREGYLDGVEMHVVESMSVRKSQLIEESDAFVILPGGTGTLEEIFDVVSRQQLELHDKPVIFLNIDGFWDPFLALIEHTVKEGFTPQSLADHIVLEADPTKAIAEIFRQLDAMDTREIVD